MALTIWKRIPAITAFILLAWQMALPWTVPHFTTSDGPSHVYGATVARELIFHHRHTIYSSVYTIQRVPVPNWTATIVLAAAASIAGTNHAEAVFLSLAILIGFLGLSYANRAIAPNQSPWTPINNFLIQTWFLWMGFDNFYLGMALLPFVIGFYIRHARRLTGKRVAILAGGFLGLYFTHLIAVAVALLTIGTIALWLTLVAPNEGSRARSLFVEAKDLLIAAVPVLILGAIYAHYAPTSEIVPADPFWKMLRAFPQQVFLTGVGALGAQALLRSLVLAYFLVGILLMRSSDWRSASGGLLIAMMLCLAAYLFMPAEGFGGSAVSMRFAWAVFMLGGIAVAALPGLGMMRVPFAIVVAVLVAGNTIATQRTLQLLSRATDSYLAAASQIPRGATLVRMSYPAPKVAERYGYADTARFPFIHLDALTAVEKDGIDLTDYEPLSRVFPIVQKGGFIGKDFQLWGFEGPGTDAVTTLDWLRQVLPRPVDYVLLFGDEESAAAKQAYMPLMEDYLKAHMHLTATSTDGLLRIYARN